MFYWGNDFYLCASVSALVLWLSNKDMRTFLGKKTNKNNKNARFILIAAISGKNRYFSFQFYVQALLKQACIVNMVKIKPISLM